MISQAAHEEISKSSVSLPVRLRMLVGLGEVRQAWSALVALWGRSV